MANGLAVWPAPPSLVALANETIDQIGFHAPVPKLSKEYTAGSALNLKYGIELILDQLGTGI